MLAKLKQAISDMMKDKAVTERLRGLGYQIDLQIGDAYKNFIMKDLEQWRSVAKSNNIKIK